MRLIKKDQRTVYLKRRMAMQDPDGTSYEGYSEPISLRVSIQPAGGKLMAEMYGERLAYMLTMRHEGPEAITEGDGLCIDVGPAAAPDYKVVAVQPWDIRVYTLEKVR